MSQENPQFYPSRREEEKTSEQEVEFFNDTFSGKRIQQETLENNEIQNIMKNLASIKYDNAQMNNGSSLDDEFEEGIAPGGMILGDLQPSAGAQDEKPMMAGGAPGGRQLEAKRPGVEVSQVDDDLGRVMSQLNALQGNLNQKVPPDERQGSSQFKPINFDNLHWDANLGAERSLHGAAKASMPALQIPDTASLNGPPMSQLEVAGHMKSSFKPRIAGSSQDGSRAHSSSRAQQPLAKTQTSLGMKKDLKEKRKQIKALQQMHKKLKMLQKAQKEAGEKK